MSASRLSSDKQALTFGSRGLRDYFPRSGFGPRCWYELVDLGEPKRIAGHLKQANRNLAEKSALLDTHKREMQKVTTGPALTTRSSPGVANTNTFGFDTIGASNLVVIVEACTNLADGPKPNLRSQWLLWPHKHLSCKQILVCSTQYKLRYFLP